jgi:EAL domain-containing protein (putative c-di-GMP-specific phosphodiesterase class I)
MSVVATIEVNDPDRLIAQHGSESYKLLHSELENRVRGWARNNDQVVIERSGRISVLLRGDLNHGQVNLAANKLLRLSSAAYEGVGESVKLPINAGFTYVATGGDTKEAAIARAATALAHAKRQNQPFCIYSPDLVEHTINEVEFGEKLNAALTKGEFVLFFQPKVNAVYRNFVGAEALIRWLPSEGKIIGPNEFMGIAERLPVIKPLTAWIAKSAIARCARWQGESSVSINVPPSALQDDELHFTIEDALSLYNLEPKRLIVEVTESIMSDDQQAMFERLARLRALGVRVSLDDFGTGYSSLAYFRSLPADELKIDQVFVRAMKKSAVDTAIVKTVVQLAKNFSLNVVAEGVEDEACADALRDLGCDILQGYFFDKPLPADELEKRHLLSP